MPSNQADPHPRGRVPLADAIESLRDELMVTIWKSASSFTVGDETFDLKFAVTPIELTLEVAVTGAIKGEAGIKWWVATATASSSREN